MNLTKAISSGKKSIPFLAALFLFTFSNLTSQDLAYHYSASVGNISKSLTSIEWKKDVCEFGEIQQNVPAVAEFEFINTGTQALIINKVLGSCGCTATKYAKEPILPGEKSKITATYNAKSLGAFTKTLTVYSNDKEGEKRLKLKGIVIKM